MDQTPRSNLTDREMLLLLADQNRRMEQTIDRLVSSIESRLAQGDRRFAEQDARLTAHDARHTAANTAINTLDGRVIDLGRGLAAEQKARGDLEAEADRKIAGLSARLEAQADEWKTWKTWAQVVGTILGFAWGFVTFVWPFLPRLIQLVDGGGV